jgi:hypothetical protein
MTEDWVARRAQRTYLVLLAAAPTLVLALSAHASAAAEPFPPPASATAMADSSVDGHLRRGLALFGAEDFANAVLEFEAVLRRDGLPPTPHQQAEIYADAARAYLAGQRFQASGYALLGFGNYAENDTSAGKGQINDMFFSARGGIRANYPLSGPDTLNVSLDYRFRNYDNASRHVDSDLRWNANVSRVAGNANIDVGVRGRANYRGNGQTRNDYGVFTEFRFLEGADDQFTFGAELRRREYPQGSLRERSRNIVEFSGGWRRALFDGKASLDIVVGGGLERATDDRPDGDSAFYNVSPTFNFALGDHIGGYAFLWWQNDAYNVEVINTVDADYVKVTGSRNDDLVEVGGGLAWAFAHGWSVNPEVLWIRDFSNVLAVNYSSTELHLTLRRDF